MPEPIYLDHHSTTPVDPRVLEAMLPYFTSEYGNASNRSHRLGRRAAAAVEQAREQVAAAIGACYSEIFFTSGATESNALAICGAAPAASGRHLITTAIEHPSVLHSLRRLQSRGWRLSLVPVDRHGLVDPRAIERAITPDTALVSVMAANNEIGTIEPLAEIGAIVRRSRALFHTDATQAVGRIPIDVEAMAIDLLALSAHKIYGPKGVGALYVRRRPRNVEVQPLVDGGGHEQGLRPGTLNVPGIVGLGLACEIALHSMEAESERLRRLRRRLETRLLSELDGVVVHGHPQLRLSGNLNVGIEGVDADALLLGLPDLAVSAGAACSSSSAKPSHVLEAIGASGGKPHAALRFGIGRHNTEEEIERAAGLVVERVRALRAKAAQHAALASI